tara:strand:+ start:825 stop:1697 length:873 start_codon:yes stop_codon:yes gene_type:complete
MDQEQVGNAQEAPESDDLSQPRNSGDVKEFFGSLDQTVNSGILDEASQETSNQGDNTPQSPSEVQQEDVDSDFDYDTLNKRYSASSKEGKRLNKRLKDIEPYMPILDAMKEDPNLIQHVRNYFEGGGQAPQSMTEKLDVPEDFVFDPDEAFQKPDSDSAKVFGATVDGIVQRRLGQALNNQKEENSRLNTESAFRQKHDMNDDDWAEFVEYAKDRSLSLDDILFLKNRKLREKKIAKNASGQIVNQMKKVQNQPRTLATSGSTQTETSPDDQIFESILGIDRELETAFGQ